MNTLESHRIIKLPPLLCFISLALYVAAQDDFDRNEFGQMGGPPVRATCPGPWQFTCDNYECIAQYDRCDGIAQCSDASDEKNCNQKQTVRPMAPMPAGRQVELHPKPPTTTTAAPVTTASPLSPRLVGGLIAFAVLAAIVHVIVRRKKRQAANVRGFRKGETLVEDEDDLLISQMYA